MKTVLCLLAVAACFALTATHTYHLGNCPVLEPVPAFQISRFLGVWYAIQKTKTTSKCLTYNFTLTGERREYNLEQVSIHPVLGIAAADKKFHYNGKLKASAEVPAKMTVKFSMNVAGSADFTVFMTDYETYAGIYTCQQLIAAHRRSATILSRNKTLDQAIIEKIRWRLYNFDVSPYDFNVIDQTNCTEDAPVATASDSNATELINMAELNEMP